MMCYVIVVALLFDRKLQPAPSRYRTTKSLASHLPQTVPSTAETWPRAPPRRPCRRFSALTARSKRSESSKIKVTPLSGAFLFYGRRTFSTPTLLAHIVVLVLTGSRQKSQPHKPSSRSTIQTSTGKMSNALGERSRASPVAPTMPRYCTLFSVFRSTCFLNFKLNCVFLLRQLMTGGLGPTNTQYPYGYNQGMSYWYPGGYPPQMQSQFVQGMQGYAAYGQFGYQPGMGMQLPGGWQSVQAQAGAGQQMAAAAAAAAAVSQQGGMVASYPIQQFQVFPPLAVHQSALTL